MVMINEELIKSLITKAIAVRENSYCIYSNFAVGAACLGNSGGIYVGTNIENISYPVGICAERVAMSNGIANGEKKFSAIAIVGYTKGGSLENRGYCSPCGMCRQFMAEFAADDFIIILAKSPTEYKTVAFKDILPMTFEF